MMRKLTLLFLLVFGISTFSFAQNTSEEMQSYDTSSDQKGFQEKGSQGMQVVINENMQLMSAGSNNALTMAIQGADLKKVEAVWKTFSRDFKARTRKDRKSGLYFTDNARMRNISSNDVDIYAKFERGGSGTVATVWFDLGGAYIASETHGEAYNEAEELMYKFANAVGKSMAEDHVKDQEKVLKALEKELSKLEKDNETYLKKIEEAKALIAEMEGNIKQNEIDQEGKKGEIKKQVEAVDKAKAKVKDFIY